MKSIFLFIISVLLLISCTERKDLKSTRAMYFDLKSSDIYSFEKDFLTIFRVKDSTKEVYYNYKENINLQNGTDFSEFTDTLKIVRKFDANNITLVKFNFTKPKIKDVNLTRWKMITKQINRETGNYFFETQILEINTKTGIDGYYTNNVQQDTIYGQNYGFSGYYFDNFLVFKKDFISLIVTANSSENIEVILSYSDTTDILKLSRIN